MATYPVNMAIKPDVFAFFDAATNTISYIVKDPDSSACAIVDSVMDIDYAAGRITFDHADELIRTVVDKGLRARPDRRLMGLSSADWTFASEEGLGEQRPCRCSDTRDRDVDGGDRKHAGDDAGDECERQPDKYQHDHAGCGVRGHG